LLLNGKVFPQLLLQFRSAAAGNANHFIARHGARQNLDCAARHGKHFAKKFRQSGIRPAVEGRRRKRELERIAHCAGDGGSGSTGMNAHGEGSPQGVIVDGNHFG
jgi:hypothetical protein